MTEVIVKVHKRKDNIKYLIVPLKSDIQEGEYVVVSNDLDILKQIKNGGQNDRR